MAKQNSSGSQFHWQNGAVDQSITAFPHLESGARDCDRTEHLFVQRPSHTTARKQLSTTLSLRFKPQRDCTSMSTCACHP